jgi:peroxiredoxin Q/BCP
MYAVRISVSDAFQLQFAMVELRKRKEAPPAPEKPTKKKAAPKSKKGDKSAVEETLEQAGEVANTVVAQASEVAGAAVEKAQEVLASATEAANGAKPGPKTGESINLDEFGGEVETHDGKTVTLKQLVEESGAGVILFTYPKASTPGCKPS